jgi:DNA-binding MarR family transcriptional regulator
MGRGLSQRQQRILSILGAADESEGIVRIRDLRNSTCGSPSSLSRSISRLQDRGLVERLSVHRDDAPGRNMPAIRKKCTDRKM